MLSLIHSLKILLDLTKFKIALFASFSGATGFLLGRGEGTQELFGSVTGVFLLACGVCGLNQYQEREEDGVMERTKDRPIPSGRLSPSVAFEIAIGLVLLGLFILELFGNPTAWGLGLLGLFWYNGVYFTLKKKTAFAAVAGSLTGGIPLLIGWVSAGRSVFEGAVWPVVLFFCLWQIPHFWTILLDWGKDYGKAGWPSLYDRFQRPQIGRLIFVWTSATASAAAMVPLFGLVRSDEAGLGLLSAGLLWVGGAAWLLIRSQRQERGGVPGLSRINWLYSLVVMGLLSIDPFFG